MNCTLYINYFVLTKTLMHNSHIYLFYFLVNRLIKFLILNL